jgi:hypothetical protein
MAVPNWVEYAKLGLSALTPIVTGVVGVIILRLGARIEKGKQLNQALLQKRLSFFEDVAPKLNDIYCFYQARGHWSELEPTQIIKHKRSIDRAFNINRYLFGEAILQNYSAFIDAHFETFVGVGEPARLRLDQPFLKAQIGTFFKPQWDPSLSTWMGEYEEQARAYETLMGVLGKQVRGEGDV